MPSAEPTQNPAPQAATLANGQPITQENVYNIIIALKSQYPDGTFYDNSVKYTSDALYEIGGGCHGFALMCSDAAFGKLPASDKHSNFDLIKVGDLVRVANNTHTVVVLEKRADSIIVAEANVVINGGKGSVMWGREMSRAELAGGNFQVTTRYPAGTGL